VCGARGGTGVKINVAKALKKARFMGRLLSYALNSSDALNKSIDGRVSKPRESDRA